MNYGHGPWIVRVRMTGHQCLLKKILFYKLLRTRIQLFSLFLSRTNTHSTESASAANIKSKILATLSLYLFLGE